jgi:hypothetical protein
LGEVLSAPKPSSVSALDGAYLTLPCRQQLSAFSIPPRGRLFKLIRGRFS